MLRTDECRPPASRRLRCGAALLEALVALTVLAAVSATIVVFAAESGRSLTRARQSEREIRDASAFLTAVALWPRVDLERRLGDRVQGRWRLRVDRVAATLYVIALTDSTGTRDLVRTSLYRAEPTALLIPEVGNARR